MENRLPGSSHQFGPFRYDPARRALYREDQAVPLEPKVLDTLEALLERRGEVIEKADLMKRVWPDCVVEETGLSRNISILRKALDDERFAFIETVPRRGYRFVAAPAHLASDLDNTSASDRERVTAGSAPLRQAPHEETGSHAPASREQASSEPVDNERVRDEPVRSEPVHNEPTGAERVQKEPARTKSALTGSAARNRPWLAALGVLLLAALLYWQFYLPSPYLPDSGRAAVLAVVPVECLTPDLERDAYATGLASALVAEFNRFQGIQLISPSTVARYHRLGVPVPVMTRLLGVQVVVEGTAQLSGELIRVSLRLSDVRSGKLIWAREYEQPASDRLAGQTRIAAEAGAGIAVVLRATR
jgi:DNA-binding winged helix-turn-helix (wHTH) protein/TolB-like protein